MKDASKSAMFHLYAAGLEQAVRDERWPVMQAALDSGMGVYQSSSMGRLFDAVSAIMGVCAYNRFEGECAIDLENLAAEALRLSIRPEPLAFDITEKEDMLVADASPVIGQLVKMPEADPRALALGFHRAVMDMTLEMCGKMRDHTSICDVALSGGTFQNSVLLSGLTHGLKAAGFSVYINENVPPNDGGIALGQAYIGLKHLQRKESSCV
jgi:hydrogenase maturation protein HypF